MSHAVHRVWSDILTGTPQVCGIHNVTPDSFSDGGQHESAQSNDQHLQMLIHHGARIIDVGPESTRPGAQHISTQEQLERLENTFAFTSQIEERDVDFSIDTRDRVVADKALGNGFTIVNDVSAGMFDPEIIDVVIQHGALYIAMHSRGTPETMKDLAEYNDVVDEVSGELEQRVAAIEKRGLRREQIMVDPGIGFAKSAHDSITLLQQAHRIKDRLGLPMMVGVSRKSVIGHLLHRDNREDSLFTRDALTAEISLDLVNQGIDVVRVHDVFQTLQAIANTS